MGSITRRRFLEDTLIASAALAAARLPRFAYAAEGAGRKIGPNDKINIAVIGVRGRGGNHLSEYLGMKDVAVTAICDIDENVIGGAMRAVEKKYGAPPKYYQDLRKLLEDKDLDAVSIATTNHWHALAAIWAMQAGKDVYVEKPVSHEVWEGRKIVEAAEKYGRICQAGTQCRSNPGIIQAMEFLHSGKLGKISVGRGLCYKPRGSIGKKPDGPVPAGVDYDIWLGPAPVRPFNPNRFHYNWHWFWDYGNGDLGNQGIHQMDLTRWGLNKSTFPNQVVGLGGRFGYEDDGETPNTEIIFMDYGDCLLTFEVRGLKTPKLQGAGIGCIFYGTEGTLVIPSYSSAIVYDKDGKEAQRFDGSANHFRNFIDCMRSRKTEDQHGPILEGHVSSALCHLGNISYRLGKQEPFSKRPKAFGDGKEAADCLDRFQEHLKENNVPLDGHTYCVGRTLKVDPKTERFVGDAEANKLLTREYRKPFVVPDKV